MSVLAEFHVGGRPRTKGSLKVITPRGRKPILMEDHAHSASWRKHIKKAIQIRMPEVVRADYVPYSGAVSVVADFIFKRQGPTAQALMFPTVNAGVYANGDIDKLLRNLLDAMQDAKLISDDAMVVEVSTRKRWAEDKDAEGIIVTVKEAQL